MQCWFYRCQTFLCTNCRSIGKPKPSNLTLSLLSRGTVRHPRLTVYRRDLGAPNPGIGPHWSSRSGPPDPEYQISDLPGRRGLDRSTPNIGSLTSEVWESKCRIRDIGPPMSGYEVVELCPAVTIDHRAWQPNYGQIWGRQYWRQHLVIQATPLSIMSLPFTVTSYMSMTRNYLQASTSSGMAEAGGAKSELRGTEAKHNLQTIMEARVKAKLHR